MKVYSPGFSLEGDTNPHPTKAHKWDTVVSLLRAYEEFGQVCENFCDQAPAPLWVYIGEPDGNEETHGYPDTPDYIMQFNRSGAVIVTSDH